MTATVPAITISSLDLARIEALLEQPSHRDAAGAGPLRAELARAEVVAPPDMPGDIVTMNSRAIVQDETNGESRELTLVYPREADSASGKVSILAPVGTALLGLRVGHAINWKVPGGRDLRLRVTELAFQPEASGQLHR